MSRQYNRFTFYDTESSGLSKSNDQIVQFAGIGVDANLDVIPGDEYITDIRLRPDVVPSPFAFGVHGISLDRLSKAPVNEFEAAAQIREWFLKKSSCMIGFNSQSFDDEMVRNTLFRTLLDPYEHEWKNGNGRADVMRLLMMVYALRPETVPVWPLSDSGEVSMKLEKITAANGIELKNAHDAHSDIMATIDLARLIKNGNPKLWDYYLNLTDKQFASNMLLDRKPLVLVDRYLPRAQGHMTMVLPMITDKVVSSKVICCDLRYDPSDILNLSVDELKYRLFTPMSEMEGGKSILSIRDVATNKNPLIFKPSILTGRDDLLERSVIDLDACRRHSEILQENTGFRERLQEAYVGSFPPCDDVYKGLVSLGFPSKHEVVIKAQARSVSWNEKAKAELPAIVGTDPYESTKTLVTGRLKVMELTLRTKWANYEDVVTRCSSYNLREMAEWIKHLERTWLGREGASPAYGIDDYTRDLAELRATRVLSPEQDQLINDLTVYVQDKCAEVAELAKQLVSFELPDGEAQDSAPSPELNELSAPGF